MTIEKIRKNLILNLCFEFSLEIIKYCELLDGLKKYSISKQLFRSATSVGANAIEGQNSESTSDFIHKFKLAAKEGEESEYWLLLCKLSTGYPDCQYLLDSVQRINNIIGKILSTTKRNRNKNSS